MLLYLLLILLEILLLLVVLLLLGLISEVTLILLNNLPSIIVIISLIWNSIRWSWSMHDIVTYLQLNSWFRCKIIRSSKLRLSIVISKRVKITLSLILILKCIAILSIFFGVIIWTIRSFMNWIMWRMSKPSLLSITESKLTLLFLLGVLIELLVSIKLLLWICLIPKRIIFIFIFLQSRWVYNIILEWFILLFIIKRIILALIPILSILV